MRAAIETATSEGWASVTMAGLADQVGISRQTVYNEVGGKEALAEAMVLHELGAVLALVEAAFDRHPDDPIAGVRRATADVLAFADDNALLRAIVAADQGAATELLPLLTSRATTVVDAAGAVMSARLDPFLAHLEARHRRVVVDTVVRVVLSHVTQSEGRDRRGAERVGRDMGWLAGRLIDHPDVGE